MFAVARRALVALAVIFMFNAAPAVAQTEASLAEAARAKEACRNGRGDMGACHDHGLDLYQGNGVPADHEAALKLWRLVCDKDKTIAGAQSCSNMATVYRESDVIPHDPLKAIELDNRACDRGYATGCANVGYSYRDGIGVAVNGALAVQAFETACRYREWLSCAEAGWIQADGKLVPQDDAKAVVNYTQACAYELPVACASLGFMAGSGRGMAPDPVLAVKQYKFACARNIQSACGNIEAVRGNGPGSFSYAELMAYETMEQAFPPSLPAEQRYLLAKASFDAGNTELALQGFNALVEEGSAEAAFNLARLYYDGGQGVAMDRPKAVRYFEQAAQAGHPYAMYILGEFNWYGENMAWNPDWGIAMMRGAAEAGLAEADPIWRRWQAERNAYFAARDEASRQQAIENERSERAADAANIARIWSLYSSSQNQQGNGQVCGTIYRNNQAHHECMAKETFDKYYKPR